MYLCITGTPKGRKGMAQGTGLTFLNVYLKINDLPSRNFFFFRRHENSYSLFHLRFSLILFIFLDFKLIIILFDVKAWYYG